MAKFVKTLIFVLATFFVVCSSRRSPYSVDDDNVLNLRPSDDDDDFDELREFEEELYRDRQRSR